MSLEISPGPNADAAAPWSHVAAQAASNGAIP
jgi:hypothetical protein